ncbi:unnamed protein product [Miscanthus lutarioriparius]|uniref:RING-type domain-containing protein n=1 Tax=Miscanthus lutarioriparius TaxID=422564 RepID=A0A811Q966_9POAL|nr:unnamed protein product [Miscanthus lutarioriparius]
MPLLAAAAAGGRRRLVDLCATAPTAFNWQEPLGQNGIPPWSSLPSETKNQVLFGASFLVFLLVCLGVCCLFCREDKDDEQDTTRFVLGPWGNNDDGEVVSAPPPPLQEQQPLPASGDGSAPQSNSGQDDRPPRRRRRRRRQQPPAVAEVPAADVELALGEVQLTQAGVEWMLANMELLAPAADVDMAPAADVEIAPAPEPAPTLKCKFSTAEGWTEGTCSVCLSELVDGEKVRVLTACMHYFHATCIETWLRGNATCPLCRAPAMAVPARGRRRRRPADPNLGLA